MGSRRFCETAAAPSHGTLAFNSDGTFVYTPNAGYAGTAGAAPDVTADSRLASDIVARIERGAAALCLVLLLGAAQAGAATDAERWFAWDEANSRMGTARTPLDFAAAATAYRNLVDGGVRNGPLFFNLGTALLKAGQPRNALAALQMAEIYMGSTMEIQRNMIIAANAAGGLDGAGLPWYRVPLFWHFGLPAATRLDVAVGAFALLWVGLLLLLLRRRGIAAPVIAVSLIAVVMFGSSVVASLQSESRLIARINLASYAPALPEEPGGKK